MAISGRPEGQNGRPASPNHENSRSNSRMPSFTQEQMKKIALDNQKYMKYTEEDYKRISDEILNNMLDDSVAGLI